MRAAKSWYRFVRAGTVVVLYVAVAAAETLPTPQQLYRDGLIGISQGNCVKAARYLFAYTLNNPPELQARPDVRATLQQVISNCEADPSHYAYAGNMVFYDAKVPTAQGLCDIYSQLALTQNLVNEEFQCGLSGPRWNSNYQYHYSWCLTVTQKDRETERSARREAIRSCTGQ